MPVFDAHANFAYSLVAAAPSPADSGVTLTVSAGDGTDFPVPGASGGFNCVVWPTGSQASDDNAEIVRVTAVAGDVFTIVRGPLAGDPGGVNRSIVVGDQIGQLITLKMFTDLEAMAQRSFAVFAG